MRYIRNKHRLFWAEKHLAVSPLSFEEYKEITRRRHPDAYVA